MKDESKPASNVAEKMHPVVKLHHDIALFLDDQNDRKFKFEDFQKVYDNVQSLISAIEEGKKTEVKMCFPMVFFQQSSPQT